MSIARKIPIAITTGDHRGIGPEIIAKGLHALRHEFAPGDYVVYGDPELYAPFKRLISKQTRFIVPETPKKYAAKRAAYLCGRYIEEAVKGCMTGQYSAIVTGPIDKNELRTGGYMFDGHTEMLKELTGAPTVTMMLAAPKMRVTLVTTHIALKDVSQTLTEKKLMTCLENTNRSLREFWGIKQPRLAALGLNPHAGDHGLFGSEEQNVIVPTLQLANAKGLTVSGPHPADGFFAQWKTRNAKLYDAVVCMYHDQGLIPIKLFDFKNTVNVTLGLPIVRTSVDHGIGLDIAGKGVADPSSFQAALLLAKKIVAKRSKYGVGSNESDL